MLFLFYFYFLSFIILDTTEGVSLFSLCEVLVWRIFNLIKKMDMTTREIQRAKCAAKKKEEMKIYNSNYNSSSSDSPPGSSRVGPPR